MASPHQATFVRADLLRSLQGFDTRYRIAADYDLFLRLKEHGTRWSLLESVLADFSLGGTSYAIVETAREYRQVRIAHGQARVVAWALFVRNVIASVIARRFYRSAISR
jgi:glycosyltransferase